MLEPHDYEPGDVYVHMHSDPLCRICGYPANTGVHNADQG